MAFVDQALGRAYLSGGAVATLEGVVIDEGLLERVQDAATREPFDRRYRRAIS
jgi:hypothetical protein